MTRSRTTSNMATRRRRGRRLGVLMLIASSCASLAILPAAGAQAKHSGPASGLASRSAASAFCAHFPASKISSIVGAKVASSEAIPEGRSLECIFEGLREVVISRKSPVPVLTTLAKAEAAFKAGSPQRCQDHLRRLALARPDSLQLDLHRQRWAARRGRGTTRPRQTGVRWLVPGSRSWARRRRMWRPSYS